SCCFYCILPLTTACLGAHGESLRYHRRSVCSLERNVVEPELVLVKLVLRFSALRLRPQELNPVTDNLCHPLALTLFCLIRPDLQPALYRSLSALCQVLSYVLSEIAPCDAVDEIGFPIAILVGERPIYC